jgi:hypothetical protein
VARWQSWVAALLTRARLRPPGGTRGERQLEELRGRAARGGQWLGLQADTPAKAASLAGARLARGQGGLGSAQAACDSR